MRHLALMVVSLAIHEGRRLGSQLKQISNPANFDDDDEDDDDDHNDHDSQDDQKAIGR